MRIVQGVRMSWDPRIAIINRSHSIRCIAWSPCSRFIAISLDSAMEIQILDAATLKRLKSFTPPHHSTHLLAFSPEGRSLMWLGGESEAFTSWDLQTGVRTGEIPTEGRPSLYALAITHSGCGTMLGLLSMDDENHATALRTYNILSGTLIYCHPIDGMDTDTIWTHGDCIRFTTFGPASITIWEVGFTSHFPPTEVESLRPIPNNFGLSTEFLFLPTPARLASIIDAGSTVLVWDARYSKLLLNFVDVEVLKGMSFSSNGQFFACTRVGGSEICLWKESPTGYILHRKLLSIDPGTGFCEPLLSPNGQSIVASGDPIFQLQLWRTADTFASLPSIPTRYSHRFLLEISPDGSLAVAARIFGSTARVLDLKSGVTPLVIETGMDIHGLRVAESTIAVVGDGKVVTWNLPAGDRVINARANVNDSVRTTIFDRSASLMLMVSASVSPDFNHIAVAGISEGAHRCINIYDVSTGKCLASTHSQEGLSWFTPDGREVWSLGYRKSEGWAILKDKKSGVTKLEPLDPTGGPSGGFPWQSSSGYQVTDDGWVLSPTGKRLLWLYCRPLKMDIVWGGRFLALLDFGLPEVVLLELLVE